MTAIEFNDQLTLHYSSLFNFTKRFTKSDEDSWDLVQETIAKAIASRNKFKHDTNLQGWLYTIMRNTFINNYRKEQKRATFIDRSENQFQLQVEDRYTSNNPHSNFIYSELESLVNTLPKGLYEPFMLHLEGYKYEEIADRFELPIGTIKNRIFRARKQMQSQLVKP